MGEVLNYDELKREGKKELLQRVVDLQEENQSFVERIAVYEKKIAQLENEIKNDEKKWEEAGSLADYAIKINKVLESTQQAADIYLESIKKVKTQKEKEAEELIANAQNRVDTLLTSAKQEASQIKASSHTVLSTLQSEVDRLLTDFKKDYKGDTEESKEEDE
ncbi:Mg2+ and Co2+ transporter CorA [Aequitasia blattaphilus]|uniref:Cell division protein DivIVA n=1 Tax=Aequitasia blattaphilus TaxID=2949332 RepID=A0ABT1EBP3_9FIRM|nr:hypothetical protein [Aequitasia blattaphilus]MCP1103233.1 hypothetical protein [Aequitasia blattaphilus]MCR8615873.1 hypothetical protein [Aequitasia blattaphilus]